MRGLEERYISHIDRERLPSSDFEAQGREAEKVVIEFLRKQFPNMTVRPATPKEDEGVRIGDIGKKITGDAVVSLEKKPVIVTQITSAKDKGVREEKLRLLHQDPFPRIPGMNPHDPSPARTVTFVDLNADQAEQARQILESNLNSLRFDLTQTKNPAEIKRLDNLISMFEAEQLKFLATKKGKPN